MRSVYRQLDPDVKRGCRPAFKLPLRARSGRGRTKSCSGRRSLCLNRSSMLVGPRELDDPYDRVRAGNVRPRTVSCCGQGKSMVTFSKATESRNLLSGAMGLLCLSLFAPEASAVEGVSTTPVDSVSTSAVSISYSPGQGDRRGSAPPSRRQCPAGRDRPSHCRCPRRECGNVEGVREMWARDLIPTGSRRDARRASAVVTGAGLGLRIGSPRRHYCFVTVPAFPAAAQIVINRLISPL